MKNAWRKVIGDVGTASIKGRAATGGLGGAGIVSWAESRHGLKPVALCRPAARLHPAARASVLLLSLLLSLLLCPLAARAQPRAEAPNGPPVGTSAPAFVLPDVQGRAFQLEDYKGQTLVLNFWAFWCDTWKAELPSLEELSGRQDEMNFRLVAVSVDGTRLSEFARRAGGDVPFPVLLDGGGRTSARYRVRHVPTVVIIGPDGVVRFTAYGYPGNHVILRELRKIASEK